MRHKRWICLILTTIVAFNCLAGIASATSMEVNELESIEFNVARASGRFSFDVSANKTILAETDFPMEVGESISINAVYSPRTANVEFGFIAPDGLFYGVEGEDGSIDVSIRVSQHGYYTLAVKNNSNVEVAVSGIVSY